MLNDPKVSKQQRQKRECKTWQYFCNFLFLQSGNGHGICQRLEKWLFSSSLIFSRRGKTTTRRAVIRKFCSCGGSNIGLIGLNIGKIEFKHQSLPTYSINKLAGRWQTGSFSMSSSQTWYLMGRNAPLIRLKSKKLSKHKKNVSLVKYAFVLIFFYILLFSQLIIAVSYSYIVF